MLFVINRGVKIWSRYERRVSRDSQEGRNSVFLPEAYFFWHFRLPIGVAPHLHKLGITVL